MLFGVGQFVSPLILVICLLIIFIEGISLRSLAFWLVFVFFLQYLSYYAIGVSSRMFWSIEINYEFSWRKVANNFLSSLIVLLAYQQYFYRRLFLDGALKRVLILLFIPMVASMAILLLQPLFGLHSFRDVTRSNERGLGVFSNPNTAATLANIGLVFAIDLFFRLKKKWWLFLPILIMAVVACILPLSRTGFVGLAAVIVLGVLYFLLRPRVFGSFRPIQSLVFIVVPAVAIVYVSTNYNRILNEELSYYQRSRIQSLEKVILRGELNTETTSERTDLWEYAAAVIPKRIISGYGIGYFDDIPGWIGVHNTFLVTIGNSGFLPFSLMLIVIVSVPLIGARKKRTGFLIIGLSAVTVINFMTSHNGYSDKVLNIMYILPVLFAAYDRPVLKSEQ